MTETLFYTSVGVTLLFAFVNGFHDGCNVIATVIGSRSMSPRRALLLASVAEFVGPLVLGGAVAATIAGRILKPEYLERLAAVDLHVLLIAAVTGALAWNLFTWFTGLPSSSSHALIGGLLGSGLVAIGPAAIQQREVLLYVVIPLFVSPVIGFVAGYVFFHVLRGLFAGAHSAVRHLFVRAQLPGVLFLGASHGSNDAQKSMGLIALACVAGSSGVVEVEVPRWAVFACAGAIALGLSTGGWTIIKTMGFSIFKIQPIHSFASQASSALVVGAASLLGGPVSTTQVVASSVLGVGTAKRISGVRWTLVRSIAAAWLFTIPASGAVAAGLYFGIEAILKRIG